MEANNSYLHPLEPVHALNQMDLVKIIVHNAAGECTLALINPLAGAHFRQAGDGHYMLCAEGADEARDPLASVTVRPDNDGVVKFYSERLAPELGVGEHVLRVVGRMPLLERPAATTQTPGCKP